MEKIPKDNQIKIGEQTFTKVGEVAAQPTKFKNAPKTEEVLYDIDNGALASTLPNDGKYGNYQNEVKDVKFTERIKDLDIDISALSRRELEKIIENAVQKEKTLTVFSDGKEFEVSVEYGGVASSFIYFYPKGDKDKAHSEFAIGILIAYSDDEGLNAIGKNLIVARRDTRRDKRSNQFNNWSSTRYNKAVYSEFTFSFIEVPEAYTKLMEEKKVKGEGEESK